MPGQDNKRKCMSALGIDMSAFLLTHAIKSLSNMSCSFSAGTNKLWSFSLAGNYIAAGSSGQVLFWDRRTGKQSAAFSDIHAEDVTQVSMFPYVQHGTLHTTRAEYKINGMM